MLCSSGLKAAGGVLFLVSVTCFLALLSVNSDIIIFHYLFAGFNCLQVSSAPPSGTTATLRLPDSSSSSLLPSNPPGSVCLLLPGCFQQGGEERHEVLLQPQAPGAHDQVQGFSESIGENWIPDPDLCWRFLLPSQTSLMLMLPLPASVFRLINAAQTTRTASCTTFRLETPARP